MYGVRLTLPSPFSASLRRWPLSMPIWPPSEEPKEFVISTFGKCSRKRACFDSENTAPPEPTLNMQPRSQRPGLRSSASSNGIAIASPTMEIAFTRSRSTRSHTSSAISECAGFSTTLLPASNWMHAYHQHAPCISGASGRPITTKPSCARTAISAGAVIGPAGWKWPPPPIAAKNTALCGHITPFGMPVVPPV